ncbi:DNA polymerase zeta catalytic subunit, partial [Dufourea novaeangliae]
MFSVSLVTLDSYQAAPVSGLDVTFSDFRGTEIKHVPVIRIFGSTPSGIKTCLHIHGVFPYIYIPCAIENNVDSFMYKLAAAIDSAINVSLGSAFSKSQHVYKIQRVSGIPLYGYHEKEHLFFKIYFYNPAMVKRAADLLQNGTILNQNHQPYEAHIPFILQFMMDYNLYGMSLINLKIIKYRQRITMGSKENSQNESLSNSDSQIYLPASVIRQSTCKLEVDAQATEILNREEIQNGLDLNPGIAAIWNDEKCRRVANGLQQSESQLLYTNTNDRVYGPTNNDIYQEQRLIQRLQTISQVQYYETVASVTPSVLTYPLEVESEDNPLTTSHMSNHFKLHTQDEENKKEQFLNNELLKSEKSCSSKQALSQDKSIDTSVLDTDDMQLVEMLVNLAESNEDDIIVDDDSVLASQYSALSNEIKEDNEDEEIEDLNITSLDLDSLSSWNTVSKTASQSSTTEITNGKEKSAVLENDTEDISLLNFPQFDVCFTQDNTEIVKEFVDSEVAEDNTSNSKYVKHITPKSNKEVRKRLSFLNANDNEIDSVKDNIDEKHSEHLSLTEKILNKSHENDDSAVASVTNFTYDQNFIKICTKENEKVNCDNHLPSTSGNNTDLCIGNLSGKVLQENEEENIVDEDEKDICNMTYMQLLNKKLESEIENSSFLSLDNKRDITKNKLITITTKFNPPTRERIMNTAKTYDISGCKSSGPFFSNKVDLIKHKESSNRTNDIGDLVPFKSSLDRVTGIKLWRRVKINEFYPSGSNIKSCDIKRVLTGHSSIVIESLIQPPTSKSVTTWLQAKQYLAKRNNTGHVSTAIKNTANETFIGTEQPKQLSQTSNTSHCSNGSNLNPSLRQMLENPLLYKDIDSQQHLGISYGQIEYSMKGDSGNVADENFQNAKGITVHQYLTIFSLEVHVITRDKLLPDPEHDSMGAIFYAIYSDVPSSSDVERIEHGAIVVTCSTYSSKIKNIYSTSTTCPTSYVSSEEDLLNSLITLIRHSDPDILIGWEIESHSWGYIMQRATHIGYNNLTWQISRIPNVTPTKGQTLDKDNLSDVKIPGRIVLDVWRIMRHEIGLLNYTFENVIYHVLRERIACPTFQHLTDWWKHNNVTIQWRVIFHYVVRVVGTLRILIHLDIIGRTCEHARLFGIQFYEVFSRGSQFRVESMMLRLAKPLNYVPISPSVHQRARMRAPESLPLIMEPQSVFYTDPLIVLDFQSLYPSIIIAYNYCYSTCLGRIEHIGQSEPYEFGAATLKLKGSTIRKLQGKMNFSPCGVAFVTPEVRLGILPRMLAEILNTRLMVKGSMKLYGNENRVLQRVLHSQQLGLKLIANVTYGYTSANFSGRMPCIEIGDSVVSKGRETLERAIKIVESTPKWGARVVYGDTDSLFILLPGKSREDAFTVGAEIADTVTAANPPPVKLKFEKVLQPAILQTKKRYCGYMYESVDQKEPKYLAKGIETVRRDGCPAATKILEKSLKILFDTKDLSLLKLYVTRQFDKILRRKISIQDLTFAREFRGLQGYKASACVPALELTRRLMRKDPRAIPRVGERVRYVIVAGAPNQPLIHCVRTPMEVISDEGLNTNSVYYITKVIIPPLNRCLNLIGIDVHTWYREMSHRQTPDKAVSLFTDNQKQTIRQFFSTVVCAACGDQTQKDICTNCVSNPSQTVTILHEKMRWLERSHSKLTTICQSCIGYLDDVKCESLDCPIFYRLTQARRDLVQIPYLDSIICN